MKRHLPAMLVLVASMPIYAADTTMTCQGISQYYGRNAPKHVLFGDKFASSGDVLIVAADHKWATGLLLNTKLTLCQETSSDLFFSHDCSVDKQTYISDWTKFSGRRDNSQEAIDQMAKKYGERSIGFANLWIDRINLTVNEKYLVPGLTTGSMPQKKGKKPSIDDLTQIMYVRVTEYSGSCKIEKAKL